MHNFTYWQQNLFEQIMYGYNAVLGFFVWPLIFCAVIGYVYLKQQSFVAAAVAAMIIIAVYGNYIANMDIWLSLMYILIALAVTALFLIFLSKRRQ